MEFSETRKKILTLLSDGQFHSGSDLSGKLGISRAAVWKQLNALQELGIQFSAVSGKGYRLNYPIELLEHGLISQHFSAATERLVSGLEIKDIIDSTNNYLLDNRNPERASGLICIAEYQTAGKGRHNRHWVSPFGSNIYLSIFWKYQTGPARISGLSLAIGVAVIRVLRRLVAAEFQLKWPNDIYHDGKKLGGILIEMMGDSEGPCRVVVGLGINLFLNAEQAKPIDREWSDLSRIDAGNIPSRNQLAGLLIDELVTVMAGFERDGIGKYLDEWRGYDCMRNQPAVLYIGERTIEGTVTGIDQNGLLTMQLQDGNVRAFASGEVSFSRPL